MPSTPSTSDEEELKARRRELIAKGQGSWVPDEVWGAAVIIEDDEPLAGVVVSHPGIDDSWDRLIGVDFGVNTAEVTEVFIAPKGTIFLPKVM